MDKMIIKGAGTIDEICTALNTMKAVFGKDATLEEVESVSNYGRISTEVRKQFDERGDKK